MFMDWRSAQAPRHSGMVELLFQVADDGRGLYPEHDLFIQSMKLKNTLRWMMARN